MKKTPERIEKLAAEYVLGSLRGPARRRFERWMMESGAARREVWYWEQKLGGLSDRVPEVEPPRRVWDGLSQRLWPQPESPQGAGAERRGGLWLLGGWSALATAAMLVLAVVLWQQPAPEVFRVMTGAIIEENVADPLWLVTEADHQRELSLRPVAAQAAAQDKDYELWVLPESGPAISLGVVPVGEVYRVTLDEATRQALLESQTLAITLEPKGGSPTGVATGPVLYVTRLYEL